MNSERFILGDPRFLAGGRPGSLHMDYNAEPPTIAREEEFTLVGSDKVAEILRTRETFGLVEAIRATGQAIHRSKGGYHSRPPLNLFLVRGQEPTVGVEIETVMRPEVSESDLVEDLQSNWFHFERDGSLPMGGYELITEPLPPYIYRDPHTWSGLQNALTPWLDSYTHCETGLHVHVGLRQFEDIDELPFPLKSDRRKLGKYLAIALYFCVLDRGFVDRVMLRRNATYCASTTSPTFQGISNAVRSGGLTAREFVDTVVKAMMQSPYDHFVRLRDAIRSYGSLDRALVNRPCNERFCGEIGICSSHSGEGSEMNAAHPYTVEFRRGKGTLHSLSVHRIVELTTLVVRYAASIARKPVRVVGGKPVDVMVTPDAMYKFIAENTTSAALRQLAEKAR